MERYNATLLELLKKQDMLNTKPLKLNQTILNRLVKSYNTSYHSVIDMTPQDALLEKNRQTVLKRNEKYSSVEAQNIDDIKEGDKVRIAIQNIDSKEKPFRLQWSESIYTVKQVRKPTGKNLTQPIKYKINGDSRLFTRNQLQRIPHGVENKNKVHIKYTPEKITDVNLDDNTALIKWKGYSSKENTWEDMDTLRQDLKGDFNKLVVNFVSDTAKGRKYEMVLNKKTKKLRIRLKKE